MEWISVDKELPKEEQKCLLFTETKSYYTGRFIKKFNQWSIDGETMSRSSLYWITHWMPLPNPPKE